MPLSIPTTSALPSTQRLPATHRIVHQTLSRLTRPSLLSLALDWLDDRNIETTNPYLTSQPPTNDGGDDDDDDLYPPSSSPAALRDIYTNLQTGRGSKRDVLDRILEGDWRHGISLYQLAMADMQYLYDHPSSQKWTALKIVRLTSTDGPSPTQTIPSIPRFHPSTFLQNLQREVLPDVKAHYNLDRHPSLPLTLLRILVVDSPYNTHLALAQSSIKQKLVPTSATYDARRTFYVVFPDASPYIYISLDTVPAPASTRPNTHSDSRSLRKLVLDGIPRAFSRPRERYKLTATNLAARNLEALVQQRGGGRTNDAGGGWGVYADEDNDTPLDVRQRKPRAARKPEDGGEEENSEEQKQQDAGATGMKRKRQESNEVVQQRKRTAQTRFGNSARPDDGLGIERLDVRIDDAFPVLDFSPDELLPASASPDAQLASSPAATIEAKKRKGRRSTISIALEPDETELRHGDEAGGGDEAEWRPDVRVTFLGQHVFAGLRALVETGVVDGRRMPAWMTGEEGVSVGVVRGGRMVVGTR